MNIEHIEMNQFKRIYSILLNIESYYIPKLSEQVNNIGNYAKKLAINAETFILLDNGKDIGILSVYCNDIKKNIAYITTLGIHGDYNGKGFSNELLNYVLNYIKMIGFHFINLEVNKSNKRAIQFYEKNKFYIIEQKINSNVMQFLLNPS